MSNLSTRRQKAPALVLAGLAAAALLAAPLAVDFTTGAVTAKAAFAKNGADDPAGHEHQGRGRGGDDGAGHD